LKFQELQALSATIFVLQPEIKNCWQMCYTSASSLCYQVSSLVRLQTSFHIHSESTA